MACNDVVSAILHYKRNIEKISDPPERALKYEDRLLHCINKLYKLPVSVNHLQETGVGRTVNALRKIEGEKGLGDAAKALVAKWKTMVMLEDEAERKQREETSCPSEEDVKRIKMIREAEKAELKKTETSSVKSPESQSSCHESGKKSRNELDDSKSRKRKYESDGDEKNHSKRRETLANGVSEGGGSEIRDERKSKNHSSSSKSEKSHKSHESKDRKREADDSKSGSHRHPESSGSRHDKSKSEKHEHREKKKAKDDHEDDGIDSQSGASFADALGPILVKKSKKKSHGSTVTSPSTGPSQDQPSESSPSKSTEIKKNAKEMLFSTPKLEPLEPDLVATLPTPTPYYKPHPSYIPSQEAVRRRVQAEEDALTTIMSNKNSRTKVYSGVKGGLSYVPSLYECCCRVLQQHIDALEYTGGIPFSLLKPVLDGATPSQLYRFEHFNPYIVEDTDELWKFHVNKEFRNEKRQEFESWRDMYLRCIDEREEKYKAVTANIIQRTIENSVPVRKAKLAYIDSPKPPRNILRKQIKNGTAKPDSAKLLGKNDPEAVRVSAPKQPSVKEPAILKMKPKVAPLMQKTLKSIKMSRFKRW